MDLTNEFRVGVPVERAWTVFNDVELIAPCMPGAQLQEAEGEEYRGIVKVKVGPITAQYKGKARFVERDEENHRLVLKAEGRDTRGQGNASATITATMQPDGDSTDVKVVTDLMVTGKVAQFGRGVMIDVSTKLLTQFVQCLEGKLRDAPAAGAAGATLETSGDGEPAAEPTEPPAGGGGTEGTEPSAVDTNGASSTVSGVATATIAPPAKPAVRKIDSPEPEPVDLLDAAGSPVVKRVVPILAVLFVLLLLRRLRRRG